MKKIYQILYSIFLTISSFIYFTAPVHPYQNQQKSQQTINQVTENSPIILVPGDQFYYDAVSNDLIAQGGHGSHGSHGSHTSGSGGYSPSNPSGSSWPSYPSSPSYPSAYPPIKKTVKPSTKKKTSQPPSPQMVTRQGRISFVSTHNAVKIIYFNDDKDFRITSNTLYSPSSWRPSLSETVKVQCKPSNPNMVVRIVLIHK